MLIFIYLTWWETQKINVSCERLLYLFMNISENKFMTYDHTYGAMSSFSINFRQKQQSSCRRIIYNIIPELHICL